VGSSCPLCVFSMFSVVQSLDLLEAEVRRRPGNDA